MAQKLKKQFIQLLEKDVEFRYTVAGYLGLDEILRRLASIEEEIRKLWQEVKDLREGQEKLWQGQERLWEEVKSLREGQNKLWEEVRSLREGQERLWEGQNKLWEEVRSLREGQNKLWESHFRLERYVRSGFEGLRKALHITFEDYSRSFTQLLLDELGYGWREVVRKVFVSEGRPVEVDIFCEDPLVVGEATSVVESWENAQRELADLLMKVELVSGIYQRKPVFVLLCVGKMSGDVAERLRTECVENDVRLVLGPEIREAVV
ncbi:MAG: hypothetical protein QXX19_06730 [Candidatus Caldarchaeum sp.]